jgi:hypothetical protein
LLLNSADRSLSPGAVSLLAEFDTGCYLQSRMLDNVFGAFPGHTQIPLNFQKAQGRSTRHFCCAEAQGGEASLFRKKWGLVDFAFLKRP